MKKHLLRLTGLAALVLLVYSPVFAQNDELKAEKDTSINRPGGYDEIIIKHKNDKDAKVTVEIKNGEVFINGKPASEYHDDDIAVSRRKIKIMNGRNYSFGPDGDMAIAPFEWDGPDGHKSMGSPFRNGGGAWSYEGRKKAVDQAYLGVSSRREEDGPAGAKITAISDSSAAAKAGLKVGDLITKVDETKIEGPEDLAEAVHRHKPQEKATITFKRDGKEQTVTAMLGRSQRLVRSYGFAMPDMKGMEELQKSFDLDGRRFPGFEGFNRDRGPRLGIRAQDTEDGKGVKVLDVDDESAAAKAGVKEGDVITRLDGREVNSTSALVESA
ncbi:MAG: PDZ domain-containing protein, partial [Bacteroidetes bacterium]|nr:PDZ domain-containing protein [Bacteroidota bacterium]